ncbi:MAG: 6-carboxytetrahydropterin synthase [Sulfolobales archaeon]
MRICVGVRGIELSLIHATRYFGDSYEKPHGHTYYIDVCVEGDVNERGYIIDLRELERIVREVADLYDRRIILPRDYEIDRIPEELRDRVILSPLGNATIENIGIDIARRIYEKLENRNLRINLRLREGDRYFIELQMP